MENLYPEGTSIKLVVHSQIPGDSKDPVPSVTFTCDGKFKNYSQGILFIYGRKVKRVFNFKRENFQTILLISKCQINYLN